MPAKQLVNFVQHKLTVQPLAGDTVLTWDSVSGWPTIGDFFLRLDSVDLLTTEIVKVTSVNVGANQTTVVRAQEGTSASGSFVINSTGGNDLTAQTLVDAMARLDTSLSQTLTGPLAIPTALGAAPAATSYGTVPLKFAETLLGSAAASVSFTSIPSTFRHLKSDGYMRGDFAGTSINSLIRANNDATANYDEFQHYDASATTLAGFEGLGITGIDTGPMPANTATANFFGQVEATIKHYAGTTGDKLVHVIGGSSLANTTLNQHHRSILGKWRTVATAINRLDYVPFTGGNFVTGSFFSVQLEP